MKDIKQATFSSVIWKFMERFIAQGISLIVAIIIARILDPSDYSVVSFVTIFFNFANIIISGGLNTALMQKKDADSEDYSTVLHVSIILSVVVYLILFFLAPVIASLYHQEVLIPIIRIMGLSLPITAIKSIWCAYISANLQFKKFFFATLGGTLVSAVVGILMALRGYGAWALVAQQMTNTFIDTVILILCTRIHIVLRISLQKFKVLFKYGWKILLSSFIGTAYTQLSPLAIGLKFTKEDLSFYTKGNSFPTMLSSSTTNTFSAVLFPVLAKYQDDKEKILKYTRLYMKLASFVAFPFMLGFLAVADNFVNVILTEKWSPATFYIRIFCIASMFDIIAVGNCETIKAIGRSDVFLIMEIIKKSCYFITLFLFIFLSNSPEILSIASIVCAVVQILVNSIPNIKLIGYKVKYQIMDLLPNAVISVLMCVAVYFIGKIEMNNLLNLVLQVVSGIGIYLILSIITKNKNLNYTFNVAKSFLKKKGNKNG